MSIGRQSAPFPRAELHTAAARKPAPEDRLKMTTPQKSCPTANPPKNTERVICPLSTDVFGDFAIPSRCFARNPFIYQ